MDNTIIEMTPAELEAEKSQAKEEATKGIKDTVDSLNKKLEEFKKAQKEQAEKKAEEETLKEKQAKDKELAEKQKQGVLTNPEKTQVKVMAKSYNTLGMWGAAHALGRKNRRTAIEELNEYYKSSNDEAVIATLGYMSKSLNSATPNGNQSFINSAKSIGIGDLVSGGELAAPDVDSDYIELLRPTNSVQAIAGLRRINLVNGQAKINGTLTGANAYHVGSTETTQSDATFRQIKLSAKKVAALSLIDNDILRLGDQNVYNIISDDLISGLRTEWDRGILVGTGSDHEPVGLINAAGNTFSATGSESAITIGKDLRNAKKLLQDDNVRMDAPVWVMRPSMRTSIEDQYSTNKDQMHYAARLETDGKLLGYPVVTTNNMPSGSDQEIILMDASDVVLATGYGIVVDATDQRYFENDQTAIRGLLSYDVGYRHQESICTITGVNAWEAV